MVEITDQDRVDAVDTERSRALTRQANALRAEGKWEEALPFCYEALRADPNNAAAAHNLGVMLSKMGRLAEGEAASRHALKISPGTPMALHALAHNLLAQGRYREAWPLYEARVHMPELNTGFPTSFAFPRWRGEDLARKRLTIFPEQGLGDQIQFARFLPRLIAQAEAVTLLALPPLERLFRHNFPGAQIVRATGNVEFPDPDYWTTLHDLPAALAIALEDVPTEPYLRAPGKWPPLGDGFKVGLKIKGNPKYVNDATRSLPAAEAERLRTGLPGRVISLEPQESGATDMADTAAIIDQLDMVVSVDTSVAHLAGAMGKPCLLLIPGFSTDWRWMVDRTDSPWYPNHALYRGEVSGDWRPAVERLVADANNIATTLTARAQVNRAIRLRDEGHPHEALAAAEQAVAIDPDDGRAVQTFGVLLSSVGRTSESEMVLRRFLADHPDHAESRHALALNLLFQGRYHEAWPYFDARIQTAGLDPNFPRNFPFPRWSGEGLKGKRIVLFPEQGFGDHIQFSRFIPELRRRGAEVTLLTMPSLVRLFAHNFPDVDVLPTIGTVDFPDPDFWATLVDLPAMLDVGIEGIPAEPYLRWPEAREIEGDGPRIGIKLAGNPKHRNDAWRSLSEAEAQRLREQLSGTIVSLEPQDTNARDFADTAAIIAGLDMVIAVDTSVAHLAGAMGKPCLLLLSGFEPDWRWMSDRADSPWYPRHQLFRGKPDGDWTQAIDQLAQAVVPLGRRVGAEKLMGRAQSLRAAGEPLKALAASAEAVETDPTSVNAAYMHGVFLSNCGRLSEAETLLRRVLAAAPDLPNPRDALATNLLAQGRYAEGWPLYEARTEREGLNDGFPRDFPYPRWKGEDLKGKRIAIFPEQGFGDQIQYVRFVPRLLRAGAQVTLLTKPPLARLFAHNFPQIQVLEASGSVDFPDPDYWATLADLPVRMAVTSDKLWGDPYLHPLEEAPEASGNFRIGLMTRGNPSYGSDLYRSLPPELGSRLERELAGTVVDLAPEKTGAKDFADTAAIIATLDMVVSVDTSVAHLAGAMGKLCLLMLPGFATDWRWMRERKDSPWYPEHILYRTEIETGWEPVVRQIIQDVKKLRGSAFRFMREAVMRRRQGRHLEALEAGRKALAAEPNHPGALHNQGRLLVDLGRVKEAEEVQRRAVTLVPGEDIYRYGLGLNLLSQGRYREGWPLYESRTRIELLKSGFPRGVTFPRWQGEDIRDKRIAIFPEQGFGDQIQFARFIPRLQQLCAEVVLLAPPGLVRLFQTAFPGITVVAATGATDFPRSHVWTTLVELGRLLDVRIENIPDSQYLSLENDAGVNGRFRIGFMSAGNPDYANDASRSLPPAAAGRLRAALAGDVVDLEPAVTGAKDFLDTARIMVDLDLIVSVDTSVGHLAGAMGKPCCLLVGGFATDWRWLQDRADSPWYARHRLYRGSVDGDWEPAIEELVADVSARAGNEREKRAREQPEQANERTAPRWAAVVAPGEPAPARQHGILLTKEGKLEEGEAALRAVVAAGGDDVEKSRFALALNLLAQGRYTEAWPFYRARRNVPELGIAYPQQVSLPPWTGEALDGKRLIILPEQGLGDTIQLARFLPGLIAQGAAITLFERPALTRLLRQTFPDIAVRDLSEITQAGLQDFWTTTFDIMDVLQVTLEKLPPANYLALGVERKKTSKSFSVGFCASGNPKHGNDRWRSLSAKVANNLRKRLPGKVLDLSPEETGARDLADTAKLMSGLDLIVSVDTSVAHLAGALGRPCLLMVPGFGTDWRWLRGRSDSPWYPGTHRLFFSDVDGNWADALDRLVAEAKARARDQA